MNSISVKNERERQANAKTAFRRIKLLVGAYLTLSIATLVAIILMHGDESMVNSAVWIRGTILAATSLLMLSFAIRAARGSRRGYVRLRIASAVVLLTIVGIVFIPATFPMWMKFEQVLCGLLLLAVVLVVNGSELRSLFSATGDANRGTA